MRRAQVAGTNAEIVVDGELDVLSARLPRPLLYLCGS